MTPRQPAVPRGLRLALALTAALVAVAGGLVSPVHAQAAPAITEFTAGLTPNSRPSGIAAGPDGNLWFTEVGDPGRIGRITRGARGADGRRGRRDRGRGDADRHGAAQRPADDVSVTGPDRALWFTRQGDDRIGRRSTSGEAIAFPTNAASAPFGITVGPDEALRFTAMGTDRIARITADGDITEFPLPSSGAMASMITAGPDGALWFTLNQANAIGRLTVDGDLRIYPLPTRDAGPVGIAATSDAIWFVEIAAGQVGHISPDGAIHEFELPDRAARPHAIVADAHDRCWLSQWGNSRVARVTANGHVREIALPAASEPHGLTIGPEGALWVALEAGSVARIDI